MSSPVVTIASWKVNPTQGSQGVLNKNKSKNTTLQVKDHDKNSPLGPRSVDSKTLKQHVFSGSGQTHKQ